MCEKSANDAFRAVAARLAVANRLLIVTHARPDGDGLGAMAALARAARAAGRTVEVLVPDPVPARFAFLLAGEAPAPPERFGELAAGADAVVILDTASLGQLEGLQPALAANRDKAVVIDHHRTVDDVAAAAWVDPDAAAVGVMVLRLLAKLGWPADRTAREALLAAIAYDTGWLQFTNTNAACLRAVADLLEAGVDRDALYRRLYQSDRPQRLQLMQRALGSLRLHCGGRVATMAARLADFAEAHATPDETDNFANEALRIATVDVAVLLTEEPDQVRASLRSKALVDVAAVARRFGGGGHTRAAGARSRQDLDAFQRQIVQACREQLGLTGATQTNGSSAGDCS